MQGASKENGTERGITTPSVIPSQAGIQREKEETKFKKQNSGTRSQNEEKKARDRSQKMQGTSKENGTDRGITTPSVIPTKVGIQECRIR